MHSLLSNLMAAALGIHAVLGCSWHHAQACSKIDAKSSCVKCAKHQQQSSDESGKKSSTPCGCKLGCHTTCTYLPTQKVSVDSQQLAPSFFDFVVASINGGDIPAPVAWSWETIRDPGHSGSSQRLHLLHQVFLI